MKKITSHLIVFACGLVFGIGALFSGMSNPEKVLNFFDIAGTWDPSLAFVMGGALIVTFVGFKLVLQRDTPVFSSTFQVPTAQHFDAPLVVGSLIFGVGWGLGGLCPGPALAALPVGGNSLIIFVVAMIVGLALARFRNSFKRKDRQASLLAR